MGGGEGAYICVGGGGGGGGRFEVVGVWETWGC